MPEPVVRPAIREFGDAEQAGRALAEAVAAQLASALARRGRASLAVSGGRSPVPLFAALRTLALDWSRVWVTLVDERWVGADSKDSNERFLREHLLRGAAENAHFVPLKSHHADPAAALADRSRALLDLPRPLDAVVLGVGDDGHTASLFPGAPGLEAALDPGGAATLAMIVPPHAAHPRITQTLASLLDARRIDVLMQGAEKRRRIEEALAGASPLELPIAAVLRQEAVPVELFWSPG